MCYNTLLMLSPVKYLTQVKQELKKVSWPSKQQTINQTILVIAVSVVIALYLTGLDFILSKTITNLVSR